MLCALRSSAAVGVLVKAGLEGSCANLSGLGLNVDLIVRTDVYAIVGVDVLQACCCVRAIILRVDAGKRNDGGSSAQLGATLRGIVVGLVLFVMTEYLV